MKNVLEFFKYQLGERMESISQFNGTQSSLLSSATKSQLIGRVVKMEAQAQIIIARQNVCEKHVRVSWLFSFEIC